MINNSFYGIEIISANKTIRIVTSLQRAKIELTKRSASLMIPFCKVNSVNSKRLNRFFCVSNLISNLSRHYSIESPPGFTNLERSVFLSKLIKTNKFTLNITISYLNYKTFQSIILILIPINIKIRHKHVVHSPTSMSKKPLILTKNRFPVIRFWTKLTEY